MTAATGAGRGSKVIFEEEDDEDVVGLGLEKEWKKAWGLVNMISCFVLSFSCWSELEWLAKGANSFFQNSLVVRNEEV